MVLVHQPIGFDALRCFAQVVSEGLLHPDIDATASYRLVIGADGVPVASSRRSALGCVGEEVPVAVSSLKSFTFEDTVHTSYIACMQQHETKLVSIRARLLTAEVPRIAVVEVDGGDDVGMARKQRGFAVEEVEDELFVGGEELETRW